jgi:L,D-transpeptidase catalytic domain
MLGGVGILPSVASGSSGDSSGDTARDTGSSASSILAGAATTPSAQPSTPTGTPPSTTADGGKGPASGNVADAPQDDLGDDDESDANPTVPAESGDGKRIVFDQSDQRVWLVDDANDVTRTYLVSGSLYDNLDPGTYSVYSRSEQAYGIDDSGTMKYFVRFTEGEKGAAIGFHDIPIDNGSLVQTVAQLGTPQSHGCIRQEREDAIALWEFAPIGTEVDVTV